MERIDKQEYYSIYVDAIAVRLYLESESIVTQGRILWTQQDYDAAHELAVKLAKKKNLKFFNHVSDSEADQGSTS